MRGAFSWRESRDNAVLSQWPENSHSTCVSGLIEDSMRHILFFALIGCFWAFPISWQAKHLNLFECNEGCQTYGQSVPVTRYLILDFSAQEEDFTL